MDGKITMQHDDLHVNLRMQCLHIAAEYFGSEYDAEDHYHTASSETVVEYAQAFYEFVLGEDDEDE